MKKLLIAVGIVGLLLTAKGQTQTNTGVTGVTGIIGGIDETATNIFAPGEIEIRLGGVYVQKTGEGGTLLALEKWDVFTPNLGVGVEAVSSGQDQAAEFAYLGYRKLLGNTAGLIFVGAGYEELDKQPLGVVGLRVEHRSTKHLFTWASVSYGIEPNQKNSRGMIAGGGLGWAF